MATQTEICNIAMVHLGVELISSLADTTKQGVLCALKYAFVRDRVLKQYAFNCTRVRATITDDGSTPDHEYSYAFAFPTSYLRLLKVYNYDGKIKEENGKILADTDELEILYIKSIAEADYPADLAELIGLALAIDLCFFLVQSVPAQQNLQALFERRLRDARSINSQIGTPDDPNADVFLNARL